MTDIFIYTKKTFESQLLHVFKDTKASGLKEIVNNVMVGCSDNFKKSVMKRILSVNLGKEWWPEVGEGEVRATKELVAIWKLHIFIMKHMIYHTQSVLEFAQERLEEVEKKLLDGSINEQKYIEAVNWIKVCRERDEKLFKCCSCSAIGSMNTIDEDELDWCLTVVCLPCGFNNASTPLTFNG